MLCFLPSRNIGANGCEWVFFVWYKFNFRQICKQPIFIRYSDEHMFPWRDRNYFCLPCYVRLFISNGIFDCFYCIQLALNFNNHKVYRKCSPMPKTEKLLDWNVGYDHMMHKCWWEQFRIVLVSRFHPIRCCAVHRKSQLFTFKSKHMNFSFPISTYLNQQLGVNSPSSGWNMSIANNI